MKYSYHKAEVKYFWFKNSPLGSRKQTKNKQTKSRNGSTSAKNKLMTAKGEGDEGWTK